MKPKYILFVAALLGLATCANAATAYVLAAFTTRAADLNGGSSNLEAKVNSALSTCNQVHLNSQQGVDYVHWVKVGWYHAWGLIDNRTGDAILQDLTNGAGGCNTAAHDAHANLITLTAATTDVGGIAWEPGMHSVVDAEVPYWPYYSHEMGHNYNADHDQGLCWSCNGTLYNTVMKLNYCGGGYNTIRYYTNPAIYTNCRYIGDSTHNNAQRMRDIRWTRANTFF